MSTEQTHNPRAGGEPYQLLPPLADDEYEALKESIVEHGVMVPITVDENGVVIDGHHRKKIADKLGVPCPSVTRNGFSENEKRVLALSLNLDRRHLSRLQKQELVSRSLKADPALSDREHARRTGVSPSTVGAARLHLEDKGDVSKLDTRADAVGRQQPARRPRRPFDRDVAEFQKLLEKVTRAVVRITGDDRFRKYAAEHPYAMRSMLTDAITKLQAALDLIPATDTAQAKTNTTTQEGGH